MIVFRGVWQKKNKKLKKKLKNPGEISYLASKLGGARCLRSLLCP